MGVQHGIFGQSLPLEYLYIHYVLPSLKFLRVFDIKFRMKLLSGTLPANSTLLSGTFLANSKLLSGTLPANNKL